MPDYQAVPRPGDAQFGDPLDFSDPTGTLPFAMAVSQLEKAGLPVPPQISAALRKRQEATNIQLRQQDMATQASLRNTQDITARQGVLNSIHPDVHDALIAAERRGGGQVTLGGSWGQSADLFK